MLQVRHSLRRGVARVHVVIAAVIVAAVGIFIAIQLRKQPAVQVALSLPATTRAAATTAASTEPAAPIDYQSLVARENPDYPTTEPLAIPVDSLNDAARLVFSVPIFLDATGDLWITRADAPPVADLLKKPPLKGQVHLTRDRVVFRYNTFDLEGTPQTQLVVEVAPGQYQFVNHDGRIEFGTSGREYRWDRAVWVARERDSGIIVPTRTGIAMMRPQQRPIELYQDLLGDDVSASRPSPTSQSTTNSAGRPISIATTRGTIPDPQFLLDWRGVLAWIPYVHGQFDGAGAARFVDGKWMRLNEATGWPKRIVHLDPLSDSTVIQLVADETGNVSVETTLIDPDIETDENKKEIEALVGKLSNGDAKVRDEALDQLTRYGSGAWPILEKLRDGQPPEALIRIDQILANKTRGVLGRMILEEGPVRVVAHFADGGALLFAEAGASSADLPAESAPVTAPAWIVISPNKPTQLASPFLVGDLDAKSARLSGFSDEWIVISDAVGPQRFIGNHLEPLLRKTERAFSRVVGVDGRGRWLFRHEPDDGKTLILDPTLPDATPKLPAWQYPVEGGSVGWTADGWPVVKLGGAWVIDKDGTRPLDEKKEKLLTVAPPLKSKSAATTQSSATQSSATKPTSLLSTTTTAPTNEALGPLVGFDEDGGEYYGGQDALRRRPRDAQDASRDVVWPLPGTATGSGQVNVIGVGGRVFLFNEPGRVVRLKRTNSATEPFKYEATFSRNIPSVDDPQRIWLDPAGRIVIAYGGNKLTILFPSGTIPAAISSRMLGSDLQANQPE